MPPPRLTFLRSYGAWLRVLFTPPHAEWLNQAELLLKSFTVLSEAGQLAQSPRID